jgi:histidine phosphotransferase ChpT
MMLMAITAIPRGGVVTVNATDGALSAIAEGDGARVPEKTTAVLASAVSAQEFDARMVQVYYSMRLAEQAGYTLTMTADGNKITIAAGKIAADEAAA